MAVSTENYLMEEALKPFINFVRDSSPYFTELYAKISNDAQLANIPLINHTAYWAASNQSRRQVMTGPQTDGVVMKTGGTTNRPKTTAYSQIDLQRTTSLLARGLMAGGVRAGDRVANMFYAGDLYGSFLLHVLSIMALPVPAVHLPIGGFTGSAEVLSLLEQCDATVLLTTATSLVQIAMHIVSLNRTLDTVRTVLFGGEPLFPEQEAMIRSAFPRASIRSCIYGTIDAGVLAMAASGEDTRLYQAFTDSVIIEIVSTQDHGNVIEENDVPGRLVATNLVRQLCPVIRYPTGDRAVWVDRANGVFRLLGRESQAVRIGPISIDMIDIRAIVEASTKPYGVVIGVQAVVTRNNGLDQLECVLVAPSMTTEQVSGAIKTVEALMYQQRPMYCQHVELGLVAPFVVRFVHSMVDLQLARGSHKVLDIVDKRFESVQ